MEKGLGEVSPVGRSHLLLHLLLLLLLLPMLLVRHPETDFGATRTPKADAPKRTHQRGLGLAKLGEPAGGGGGGNTHQIPLRGSAPLRTLRLLF